MKKGATGVGSASILLVFTVLCLTIFAFITFETSRTDKALTDKRAQTAIEYYEADTFAECILAEILEKDEIPESVQGVSIAAEIDGDAGAKNASFSFPVSEQKKLCVRVSIFKTYYEILEWRIQDIDNWEIDEALPVWPG